MTEALILTPARTSSFFLPMRFMPPSNRQALMTLHAFCRAIDDAVDDAEHAELARKHLEMWRREVDLVFSANTPTHPAAQAFQRVVRIYGLPEEPVHHMLEGFSTDAAGAVRIPDWEALSQYCYRVAGCVGLLALPIMGVHSETAQRFAIALGHALQLTNIIRDLDEDMANDRWYLPQSALSVFGITPDEPCDTVLLNALAVQVADKAQSYFEQTESLIEPVTARQLIPARLMRDAYRMQLQRMQRTGTYVHKTQTIRLSLVDKAVLVAKGSAYWCGF